MQFLNRNAGLFIAENQAGAMAGHGRHNREDAMDLKGRHFLTLNDYTPEEVTYLLDLAADLKVKRNRGFW